MKKQLIAASLVGVLAVALASFSSSSQSLQQFDQQAFEKFIRENPELIVQIVNSDGSINRGRLEQILRERFNYQDNQQLPAYLDFDGAQQRLSGDLSPLDIENDVKLQKRLAEEREKAWEAYQKRQQTNPPE